VSDEIPTVGLDGRVEQRFRDFAITVRLLDAADAEVDLADHAGVLGSWREGIKFLRASGLTSVDGLRRAQLGAIHAVLAHWSTGTMDPATVVLPTGTGKTETMLSLLVAAPIERLLVVVPTDALRSQLAAKFEVLGLLGELGVLPDGAMKPSVGRVLGGCSEAHDMRAFVDSAQVIVTTPNSINACSPEARKVLFDACTTLFFDEAHHVRAQTWSRIRDAFRGRPVVQFTATPFREDGKHLQGKFVYVFPLREAQQDGVFSEIRYESVFDLVNPDEAIAEAALKILRDDLDAGLDHILMARCDTQKRADDVYRIYREKAPEFAPVIIHSGMTTRQRAGAMEEVTSRRSRAVVCVDMLGEGFDLPQLKIAAIHDPRRTLGPTLQFVGRFARVAAGTGTAAMVAARSEKSQDNRLSRLYTEDADWNRLVSELSYGSILEQQAVSEFEEGFGDPEARTATRTIAPKMSAVVFETSCEEWDPAAITDVIPASDILTTPLPVNHAANVVWFVRRSRQDVPWVDGPGVEDVVHDLFVLHWDRETQLLYINHSANDGVNADLAAAVTGGTSSLIDGERVYRAMGEMQRAVPTNVGVLDIYSRSRRFAMYAGANVHDGLEPAEEATKVQTNVFVSGFRDGDRATVGVSLKARIWSYLAARNLLDWVEWCKETGRRLQDDAIDVAEIKRNFIKPVVLTAWPEGSTVLAADWATDTLLHPAQSLVVRFGAREVPIHDVSLEIRRDLTATGKVVVAVVSDEDEARYELRLGEDGMTAHALDAEIEFSTTQRTLPGSRYLVDPGVLIHFGGDAVVSSNGVLFQPNREIEPIRRESLVTIDWRGVDIRRESMTTPEDWAAVQGLALGLLLLEDWDLIVDDDGPGEVADLVAIKRTDDDRLLIKLVHCKYSHGDAAGARVADLYELCGQAQKSTVWRRNPVEMLQRLVKRERGRLLRTKPSGMRRGNSSDLLRLTGEARGIRAELEVVLVQPGLSRSGASQAQLDVIGATRMYVRDTANGTTTVLCAD
jgi:superfamily II DNA or RNA helicase